MTQKVLFIGIGNMGKHMAINLAKAGFEVMASDLNQTLLDDIAPAVHGVTNNAVASAADADLVVSMLPSDQAVQGALVASGLLTKLKTSAMVIDCSTISRSAAIALHQATANLGLNCLDAPVSGGVKGAEAGTLSFICGGEADSFSRAQSVLSAMGENIFHAGSAGAGQVAKIANNMLLAIHMVGTAEALSFGVDNGLDPKVLSEIMKSSSGDNWSLQKYNPWPDVMPQAPASNDYAGGFMVKLMQKDLGLALAQAESSGSATPMGVRAMDLYRALGESDSELLDADFSAIAKHYSKEL